MIGGDRFWDAYNNFDFNALESAIRSETLEEAARAETRSLCWTITAIANFAVEAMTVTYMATEGGPKACGALVLSSLSFGFSSLKARHWSKEVNSIPPI